LSPINISGKIFILNKGGVIMPYISLEIGKLTVEQKEALIKAYTEATVEIAKVPPEAVLMFINEHELENIGLGGISLAEKFGKKK